MKRRGTLLWLVVYGASLFCLGFFVHKALTRGGEPAPPSYLDRLTRVLDLSEAQQEDIRKHLEEADNRIRAILDDEEGARLRQRIGTIREETSVQIREVLNSDQQALFEGPDLGNDPGVPIK